MIVKLLVILVFYLIGEGVSLLIGHIVPGSVIGMLLLFLALSAGVVGPGSVDSVAKALTSNMVLLFIPPAVGVMSSLDIISRNIFGIVLASTLSTMLVIATVGLIQQKIGVRTFRKKDKR